jgi:hypothetical protein
LQQANLPTCLYFQAYKAPLKGTITNFSNCGTNSELIKGTIANVADNTIDGWDIVDHPRLPPPSHSEDVEHRTRAMFIDATKQCSYSIPRSGSKMTCPVYFG